MQFQLACYLYLLHSLQASALRTLMALSPLSIQTPSYLKFVTSLSSFSSAATIRHGYSGFWFNSWYPILSKLQWRPAFPAWFSNLLSTSCVRCISPEISAMLSAESKVVKIFGATSSSIQFETKAFFSLS